MRRQTSSQEHKAEHHCIGHKEGDWIIFICPVCKDYQRQINCVTKQVTVRQGNSNAVHIGSHAPVITTMDNFSIN
ncbi:MAG: hypothetical protein K9J37_09480 [Saprospiraceae bacterium]|nr:hypothetical protein [Saprospiraceae bacterium]MCF8250134.1 hypothetical protein [Saprospiraceae bacterium]MCF8279398.1 hypothetical protein [Bacteroidales bacterium]MCF8311188.1 hypothetical protein [Saprospiraceae bacterium]MCF8440431.1 hypothetical protein [Saprospiraceae bacterium]